VANGVGEIASRILAPARQQDGVFCREMLGELSRVYSQTQSNPGALAQASDRLYRRYCHEPQLGRRNSTTIPINFGTDKVLCLCLSVGQLTLFRCVAISSKHSNRKSPTSGQLSQPSSMLVLSLQRRKAPVSQASGKDGEETQNLLVEERTNSGMIA
jgi:hypothetical protein